MTHPQDQPSGEGDAAQRYPELKRLIGVATRNRRFAHLLLTAPTTALEIAVVYGIKLSPAERALLLAVEHANDIDELANRLYMQSRQVG